MNTEQPTSTAGIQRNTNITADTTVVLKPFMDWG